VFNKCKISPAADECCGANRWAVEGIGREKTLGLRLTSEWPLKDQMLVRSRPTQIAGS